jgi:hypothetical protein
MVIRVRFALTGVVSSMFCDVTRAAVLIWKGGQSHD